MDNLFEYYKSLNTAEDRDLAMRQIGNIFVTRIKETEVLEKKLSETEENLKNAQEALTANALKLERAKAKIEEDRQDAANAENMIREQYRKNLQIVRDRITAIGDTIINSGAKQINDGESFSIDSLNNVLFSLNIMVEEMKNLSLWDDKTTFIPYEAFTAKPRSDEKQSPEKSVKGRKSGRKKKTSEVDVTNDVAAEEARPPLFSENEDGQLGLI